MEPITDADMLNEMERRRWIVNVHHNGKYWYVGPIGLPGKPWGTGENIREAICDAIISTRK